MKRLVVYLTMLALLLAPVGVWADPVEVTLKHSPAGQRLKCVGETFQCYTFDEWKQLLLLDAEHESWRIQLKETELNLDLRLKEIDALHEANVLLSSTNQELSLEVTRVRNANDKLLTENFNLSVPNPLPWIVFVAGLVLSTLGVGMTIGSQR